MPSWLDQWIKKYVFDQPPGSLGEVDHSLGDLASSLRDYFSALLNAFLNLVGSIRSLRGGTDNLNQAVYLKLQWLYRYAFLDTRATFSRKFAEDEHWEAAWHDALVRDIYRLRDWAWATINHVVDWASTQIYEPVMAAVRILQSQMVKWAFSSFDLLTHPPSLADLLFWPLFDFFARDPWAIARKLGDFIGRLAIHSVTMSIDVAEQILTDIL